MARQLFSNNAVSLLASPISASSTSLTVMSGHGSMFPLPAPNEYFLVTLENQTATAREIIRVTGRTGDTLTGISRAQEGTIAQAWGASAGNDTLIDHRITAETMYRAMELPDLALGDLTDVDLSTPPTVGQTIEWTGSAWVPASPSAAAWIYGQNTGPTVISPTQTASVSTATYSAINRTFKFLVTLSTPAGSTEASEVLAVVSGPIGSTTVSWNQYGRVGANLSKAISITLNQLTSELNFQITNQESSSITTIVTRLQHSS